jgi:hypothetical protein
MKDIIWNSRVVHHEPELVDLAHFPELGNEFVLVDVAGNSCDENFRVLPGRVQLGLVDSGESPLTVLSNSETIIRFKQARESNFLHINNTN